ncbi:MAG TPA: hypothetical protein DCM14_06365 [Clostridiales bacterium UBA8153]|nr:hypothetical protein [Clostridiales bacterium UBA8153]
MSTYLLGVARGDCRSFPPSATAVLSVPVANLREGLSWFEQAETAIETAGDCRKNGNYYAPAFFSRRAAEKAAKGLLYMR